MTRPESSLLVVLVLVSACANPGAGVTDLSDQAESVTEHTRFCLSLARTLSAVAEQSNLPTALQAAEETLAQAPEEVEAPARAVADHLRRADEGNPAALQAPTFETAVDELRERGGQVCDPTDPGP
jgi:hypothetical protein